MFNRAEIVDRNFVQFLRDADHLAVPPRDPELPVRPASRLDGHGLLELFESQLMSRHLDLMARQMWARDVGFYSIGSAGHEGNVDLGRWRAPRPGLACSWRTAHGPPRST